MNVYTIHKAKTELSRLIARVEAGEEIDIARGKDIVATLIPKKKPKAERNLGFGAWKGMIIFKGGWDADLTPEELGNWEDAPIEPAR